MIRGVSAQGFKRVEDEAVEFESSVVRDLWRGRHTVELDEIPVLVEEPEEPYVICLRNHEHPSFLDVRKVYLAVPDRIAEELEMVRVIDESGRGRLYPASNFARIQLPNEAARLFRSASLA